MPDLIPVFQELRKILLPYVAILLTTRDDEQTELSKLKY